MKYRIMCDRISNDKNGQEYRRGDEADLKGWPAAVIKSWEKRGRIEKVETEADHE